MSVITDLTEEEARFIEGYRALDERGKQGVEAYLTDQMCDRETEEMYELRWHPC